MLIKSVFRKTRIYENYFSRNEIDQQSNNNFDFDNQLFLFFFLFKFRFFIIFSGYGSELSKRYEWLLTIEKRIPDEKVEEETDKYWARQNQKEIEVYKKKTEHDRKRAVQETERKEKRGKGNYFL